MPQHQITISQEFNQPVESLYAWLADHNNLRQLFIVPVSRIQDGAGEVNGVGSVRRIGPWPLGIQETVTAAQPNQLIEYKITRFGGPVRNHQGRLEFSANGSGSRVTWTIVFDSFPVIGSVLETALTQIISRGLARAG